MAAKNDGNEGKLYSPTPYDDAFRVLESRCEDLLIPMVNYMFGEAYDSEAVVTRLRNEHLIGITGETRNRRITDSFFGIGWRGIFKKYHIECESGRYDGTVLIRLFEYSSRIALEESEKGKTELNVIFPHSGLLLLRAVDDVPDEAKIRISTPGGETSFRVPIIKQKEISIRLLFEKKLYFLLPFYIFNFEDRLTQIEYNEARRRLLRRVYEKISERLFKECNAGKLSAFSYQIIVNQIKSVLLSLTKNYENLQREADEYMNEELMEIIRVHDEGRAEGKAEGKTEGRAETRTEDIVIFITDKREDGISDEVIKQKLVKYYNLNAEELAVYFNDGDLSAKV